MDFQSDGKSLDLAKSEKQLPSGPVAFIHPKTYKATPTLKNKVPEVKTSTDFGKILKLGVWRNMETLAICVR